MRRVKQHRNSLKLMKLRSKLASFLVVALASGLLIFGPTDNALAIEEIAAEAGISNDTADAEETTAPVSGVEEADGPGESVSEENERPQSNDNEELGLPTSPSGQPTSTPIASGVEEVAPFALVNGGTWGGITWELRNDKLGGQNYELYLGNPDGTTLETLTSFAGPWSTNATYKANITEINIRGPISLNLSSNSAAHMWMGFTKLQTWKDLSTTPGVPFFDTSTVRSFDGMFSGCSSLVDIDGLKYWDTSSVEAYTTIYNNYYGFKELFSGCTSLTNVDALADWDTPGRISLQRMFVGCSSLANVDGLKNWNTTNFINAQEMFRGCSSLINVDGLENWDADNFVATTRMFYGCSSLVNVDGLKNWKTKTTHVVQMFWGCSSLLNVDGLQNFDVSNAQGNASSLRTDKGFYQMFTGCSSLVNIDGLKDWDVSEITVFDYMFYGCSSLTNVDALIDWRPNKVTAADSVFQNCSSLVNVDGLRFWNGLGIMHDIFSGCTSLVSIEGLKDWNANFRYLHGAFSGCSNLVEADISGWDLSNVENYNRGASGMQAMFAGCTKLRVITLGAKSRLWANAVLPEPPYSASVFFAVDGEPIEADMFMGRWQEIGTGTIEEPDGKMVGTSANLMTLSRSATQAPGTYVWQPKFKVTLDSNGGTFAYTDPDTSLPATASKAFLYVPQPINAGGLGQTVSLKSPNPIKTLPTNPDSAFFGWTTTSDVLATKITSTGRISDNSIVVYALWTKLEIIGAPSDFDFGGYNSTSNTNRALGLDPGSYSAAEQTNGLLTTIGSNGVTRWKLTAKLDPFTQASGLPATLPAGMSLDITGMTHKEQTSAPTVQLPTFSSNIHLPADGTTSVTVANSGTTPINGGGVWEITMPFNNVKLNIPPIRQSNLGYWKTQMTWSLDDTL